MATFVATAFSQRVLQVLAYALQLIGNLFRSGCIRNRNVSDPKGLRRKEIYSGATSFEVATCPTPNGLISIGLFESTHRGFALPEIPIITNQIFYLIKAD